MTEGGLKHGALITLVTSLECDSFGHEETVISEHNAKFHPCRCRGGSVVSQESLNFTNFINKISER